MQICGFANWRKLASSQARKLARALPALATLTLALAACQDPFVAPSTRAYTAVTTGGDHSCAIAEDGSAYCWGRGLDGELGTGTKENRTSPAAVSGSLKFKEITAGDNHTCALTTDGTAYCWGWNSFYQRGNATDTQDAAPVQVTTSVKFRNITAGSQHTCALGLTDSLAYCWGYGRYGQTGSGTTNTVVTPFAVLGSIKFKQISAGGNHTCGVTTSGLGYCWGSNAAGELGSGSDAVFSTTPAAVSGNLRFTQIDAGATHTCAIAAGLQMYCWGSNERGQLGTGGSFKPGLPGAPTPVTVSQQYPTGDLVAAGNQFSCATRGTTSRCWGANDRGQLGNGDQSDHYQPQPLFLPGSPSFAVKQWAAGGALHVCALVDRSVYCWGAGSAGQLGAGSYGDSNLPQRIAD